MGREGDGACQEPEGIPVLRCKTPVSGCKTLVRCMPTRRARPRGSSRFIEDRPNNANRAADGLCLSPIP